MDAPSHYEGFEKKDARIKNIEYPEGAFSHNFGDFFFYPDCAVIGIYGFPQTPHVLAFIVLPRLAFIEFMWQILWTKREMVRDTRKGQHLPRTIVFEDLSIGSNTLE